MTWALVSLTKHVRLTFDDQQCTMKDWLCLRHDNSTRHHEKLQRGNIQENGGIWFVGFGSSLRDQQNPRKVVQTTTNHLLPSCWNRFCSLDCDCPCDRPLKTQYGKFAFSNPFHCCTAPDVEDYKQQLQELFNPDTL